MKRSKHLISLCNFLQQGDLENANRVLSRDDIRIKKHFLILLEAALENPDLEPAKFIWDEFEKASSSNHLPLKIQGVQMILKKAHGKMCRLIYPVFQWNIEYTDTHNLVCTALEKMDEDILSVCWQSIDFKNGAYNWRAFFENPLCSQTILNLLKETKRDILTASFLVLADRFHCTDLVNDIFSLNHSKEVFRSVVSNGSSDLIHQLVDQLSVAEEHIAVEYVRSQKLQNSKIELLDHIVVKRQAQRIASELSQSTAGAAKRKM